MASLDYRHKCNTYTIKQVNTDIDSHTHTDRKGGEDKSLIIKINNKGQTIAVFHHLKIMKKL